jgi:DNA-binding Lrp family transcriptional regulator
MIKKEQPAVKGQDILLLAKLLVNSKEQFPMQKNLASELKISASEISYSLRRLDKAGLIDFENKIISRLSCVEFFEHAVKFLFPIETGTIDRGIKAGPSSLIFKFQSDNDYILEDPFGDARGLSIIPIYPSVVEAVRSDKKLYELICVIDILRGLGKVRHQKEAKEKLKKIILG